jgi:hypothetical protein
MQNLDTLQARYDVLESLIKGYEEKLDDTFKASRQQQAKVLEKYFTPIGGDTIRYSHDSIQVSTKNSDYSFIDIYLNGEWNKEDEKEYTGLYISNYSFRTDEIAEWVVERFEKQAYYSRVALDSQNDILAELNELAKEYAQMADEIATPLRKIRRERREVTEQIDAIRREIQLEKLMSEEGIEIEGVERERFGDTFIEYPSLEAKVDWTLHDIRNIKINRVTSSGKSADITVKVRRWDYRTQDYVIRAEEISRVRMANINKFLRYNNIAQL